jgi:hypothetical protein
MVDTLYVARALACFLAIGIFCCNYELALELGSSRSAIKDNKHSVYTRIEKTNIQQKDTTVELWAKSRFTQIRRLSENIMYDRRRQKNSRPAGGL